MSSPALLEAWAATAFDVEEYDLVLRLLRVSGELPDQPLMHAAALLCAGDAEQAQGVLDLHPDMVAQLTEPPSVEVDDDGAVLVSVASQAGLDVVHAVAAATGDVEAYEQLASRARSAYDPSTVLLLATVARRRRDWVTADASWQTLLTHFDHHTPSVVAGVAAAGIAGRVHTRSGVVATYHVQQAVELIRAAPGDIADTTRRAVSVLVERGDGAGAALLHHAVLRRFPHLQARIPAPATPRHHRRPQLAAAAGVAAAAGTLAAGIAGWLSAAQCLMLMCCWVVATLTVGLADASPRGRTADIITWVHLHRHRAYTTGGALRLITVAVGAAAAGVGLAVMTPSASWWQRVGLFAAGVSAGYWMLLVAVEPVNRWRPLRALSPSHIAHARMCQCHDAAVITGPWAGLYLRHHLQPLPVPDLTSLGHPTPPRGVAVGKCPAFGWQWIAWPDETGDATLLIREARDDFAEDAVDGVLD